MGLGYLQGRPDILACSLPCPSLRSDKAPAFRFFWRASACMGIAHVSVGKITHVHPTSVLVRCRGMKNIHACVYLGGAACLGV